MRRWALWVLACVGLAFAALAGDTYYHPGMSPPYADMIRLGMIAGASGLDKFGANESVADSSTEDLWDGAVAGAGGTVDYTAGGAEQLYVSSSSGSDAALTVKLFGLDSNWNEINETVTLGADNSGSGGTGTVFVATANTYLRVFRAYNTSATAFTGTVYFHIDSADASCPTCDGVPDTLATDVRLAILPGNDQTLHAAWTVPANKTLILHSWCWDMSIVTGVAGTTSFANVFLLQRSNGGVFRVLNRMGVRTNGTSHACHHFPVPLAISEKTDVKIQVQDLDSSSGTPTVDISGSFNGYYQ